MTLGYVLLSCILIAFTDSRSIRVRRQEESYQLPFYAPYPGRSASDLSPNFPFVGHYDMGVEWGGGGSQKFDGFLNVPIPGWGLWDIKGGFKENPNAPKRHVGVGVMGNPLNMLGISPDAVTALGANPGFQAARAAAPEMPVDVLPGGYVPLKCKPPFCNPFIHNLGVGVQAEAGDDRGFEGGLDFPIPLGPYGLGSRFPLSGGYDLGTGPFAVDYGHKMGPVDPFGPPSTTTTKRPLIPFVGWPNPVVPQQQQQPNPFPPIAGNPSDPFAGFPFPNYRK